jgi:hypothetical protein
MLAAYCDSKILALLARDTPATPRAQPERNPL